VVVFAPGVIAAGDLVVSGLSEATAVFEVSGSDSFGSIVDVVFGVDVFVGVAVDTGVSRVVGVEKRSSRSIPP
jgi:hypothetical protein